MHDVDSTHTLNQDALEWASLLGGVATPITSLSWSLSSSLAAQLLCTFEKFDGII